MPVYTENKVVATWDDLGCRGDTVRYMCECMCTSHSVVYTCVYMDLQ